MPSFPVESSRLKKAAETAVRESLKIKKDETVLIITNPQSDVLEISQALYNECEAVGARPVLAVQPEKTSLDFTEKPVIGAIQTAPDVLISMSSEKMGKDFDAIRNPYDWEGKKIDNTFHYLMKRKQTRSFWSPGVTKELFEKTVPVDYAEMKRRCLALKEKLDAAEKVHISTAAGTDLEIGLRGRSAFVDDGDFSVPGEGGNLPAGEAFISPEKGTSRGTLVFDGSMAVQNGTVKIETPIVCTVEGGFVTGISGGREADALRATVEAGEADSVKMGKNGALSPEAAEEYRKNARALGELGIGVNPAAFISGNMLIDEKAFETCHIAVGSNYDEDARALIHLDGVLLKPTITAFLADGSVQTLLDGGRIVC